jgi:uncharacterized membrane protein
MGGWMLWVVGAIVILPGIFYISRIFAAYAARDHERRLEILRDIPEM